LQSQSRSSFSDLLNDWLHLGSENKNDPKHLVTRVVNAELRPYAVRTIGLWLLNPETTWDAHPCGSAKDWRRGSGLRTAVGGDGYDDARLYQRARAATSWMPLKYNPDGSLDVYVQSGSPGKDKESNWLPALGGEFGITMRVYHPKPAMLEGTWSPPPVKLVK